MPAVRAAVLGEGHDKALSGSASDCRVSLTARDRLLVAVGADTG